VSTLSDEQDDEVLCHCSGTRCGQLRELHAQGMSLAAISRWTGALSGCGGCEWDISDFLGRQEVPSVVVLGESSAKPQDK